MLIAHYVSIYVLNIIRVVELDEKTPEKRD